MNKYKRNWVYKGILIVIALVFIIMPIHGGIDIGSWLMVKSIGIDGGDVVTATAETSGKDTKTIVGSGANLTLALDDINIKEGRYTELAHCGLVVLGSELSTDRAVSELLLLLSDGKINAGVSVIVVDTTAEQFINTVVEMGGSGVSDYVTFIDQNMHISVEKLIMFLSKLKSPSASTCLPVISIASTSGVKGESPSAGGSESGGDDKGGEQLKEMSPKRIAKTFGKKETFLTEEETRGYDWINKTNQKGIVELPNFEYNGVDYGTVTAQVESQDCGISLAGDNEVELSMEVNLSAKNREKLLDAMLTHDAKAGEVYNELSRQFTNRIVSEAQALVDFCQREQIDLLGICDKVYKYKTNQLKSPEETLQTYKISITPKITIN